MIGNQTHTARFIRLRCQGRREQNASISGGQHADRGGRRGAEQRHRQDERQERAGDPDPAELNREDVAADGQDQQEQDELDRRPVACLRGRESHQRRRGPAERCDSRDERSTSCHGCAPHRSRYGRSLGRTAAFRALLASNIRPVRCRLETSLTTVRGRDGAHAALGGKALWTAAGVLHGQRDRRQLGIVALAVLVYDRTGEVAPDGGPVPGRQVPPGADRAVPHRAARPGRGAPHAAVALRRRGARLLRAGLDRHRRVRAGRRPRARARRRRHRRHGARAHARRDRKHPPARPPPPGGQRATQRRLRRCRRRRVGARAAC